MDTMELSINRLNTKAFIAAKPTVIALIPQEKKDTPAGGYKLVKKDARAEQTLRIIELGMNQSPPIVVLTDGKQREASFWLLGLHDAEMAINDYWVADDGREWIVGDIVRSNHYETRGLVAERGR